MNIIEAIIMGVLYNALNLIGLYTAAFLHLIGIM